MKENLCSNDGLFYRFADREQYKKEVEQEFVDYYASFDPHTEVLLRKLDAMCEQNQGASACVLKTKMYEILSEDCPLKLFEKSSFFFEMASGRERFTWGGLHSEVGTYFSKKTFDLWRKPYLDAIKEDKEAGFLSAYNVVSVDHFCAGGDKLLKVGIPGIIREAEEKLAECHDSSCEANEQKKEFYECVIRANRALIRLADRFAELAAKLAWKNAAVLVKKEHFLRIAEAAGQVGKGAPRTFYEALTFLMFYRECVSSMEGIGISILGHLDRMLYPYYKADLENGRITREEALRLLCELLIYTDARFDVHNQFRETSTTIELGGCDADGELVFNEVTRLILSAVVNVRSVNTKINCRISKKHPEEFLEMIAGIQLEELPTIMMHNDDVLIQSRVRCGQDIRDARLYVGGGCHEIVLLGSEVNSRADTWINLPKLLLKAMKEHGEAESFDEFLRLYVEDVKRYHEKVVALKNEGEQYWSKYDPLVLYSSAIEGCLEKGLDVTAGGAKYSDGMLSMLGTATLIDSLYTIRRLVYEEGRMTNAELLEITAANFENNEILRQYILKKLPKYGTNQPELNVFGAYVLEMLSTVSGQKNARGGNYLPAFYSHDLFRHLGALTEATPDGRLKGAALSRGVSPSEFVATDSPLDVIQSLSDIDFTAYADSFITELTLPAIKDKEQGRKVLISLIKGFLDAEGSSLQFNLMNRDTLIAARKNPKEYGNLTVRVCGYSAVFTTLEEKIQDEVIGRIAR